MISGVLIPRLLLWLSHPYLNQLPAKQNRRTWPDVHQILNGAKTGDIPIYPTKFELLINLRTTKAPELILPPALLSRADEMIE